MSNAKQLEKAYEFHQTGRLQEAEHIYQELLSADAEQAETYYFLGLLQFDKGQYEQALSCLSQALEIEPQQAKYYFTYAKFLQSQNKYQMAREQLQCALAKGADAAEVFLHLGLLEHSLLNYELAISYYEKAITLKPEHYVSYYNLALALQQCGEFKQALDCYYKVLSGVPSHADTHYNMGLIFQALNEQQAASESYQLACQYKADYADAYCNLGKLYQDMGEDRLAAYQYRIALAINPNHIETLANYSDYLRRQNRLHEALQLAEQALKIMPEHANANYNRAMVLFKLEQYDQAWEAYTWRWQTQALSTSHRAYQQPQWQGESLKDSSILLWGEQGIGDEVMLLSFLPYLATLCDQIEVECDERLVGLLQRSFPTIKFMARTDELAQTECVWQCALGDIAHALLRANQSWQAAISQESYLKADHHKTQKLKKYYQVKFPNKTIVGIAWLSGNQQESRFRSITLEKWYQILKRDDIKCVSLQYGVHKADILALNASLGIDIYVDDEIDANLALDDFAAQISACDLVLSVDNSVAHFAGALGIPCCLLLPFVSDWRWPLIGMKSYWYASMRLIRQDKVDNWEHAFQYLDAKLNEYFVVPDNGGLLKKALHAHEMGSYSEAEKYYRQLLSEQPQQDEWLHLLAMTLKDKGDLKAAIENAQAAIKLNPSVAQYYVTLGLVKQAQGELAEALLDFDEALSLEENSIMAWLNKGIVYHQQRLVDEAIHCYEHCISLDKQCELAYLNLGSLYQQIGDARSALACYHQVVSLNPNAAEVYYNVAILYQQIKLFAKAIMFYEKALQADADYADAYCNLGYIYYHEEEDFERATAYFQHALSIDDKHVESLVNLGLAASEQDDLASADDLYEQALAINDKHPQAKYNRALLRLKQGRPQQAWQDFEWRRVLPRYQQGYSGFKSPQWQGQELSGKRVFVYYEQGFGDSLFFSRFLHDLRAQGAYVIFACQEALYPLFKAAKVADKLITAGSSPGRFHYHCPLLSLPRGLNADLRSVSAHYPYLQPKLVKKTQAIWRMLMQTEKAFKVGIMWSGNPKQRENFQRLCPLQAWLPILELDNIEFYSLQKDTPKQDLEALPEHIKIRDLSDEVESFLDTAYVLQELDLVISVDTALPNLAGAMGVETWVLASKIADWRWYTPIEPNPWYKSVRVFKQETLWHWAPVLEQVREALLERLSN